jgi:hypothetical protein
MKATRLRTVLFAVMVGGMMCLVLAIAKQLAPQLGSRPTVVAVEAQEYVRMHREVTSQN